MNTGMHGAGVMAATTHNIQEEFTCK